MVIANWPFPNYRTIKVNHPNLAQQCIKTVTESNRSTINKLSLGKKTRIRRRFKEGKDEIPIVSSQSSNAFIHTHKCTSKRSEKEAVSQRLLHRRRQRLPIRRDSRLQETKTSKLHKMRRRRTSQRSKLKRNGDDILILSDLAEDAEDLRLRRRAKIEKAARPPLMPDPMAKPFPAAEMQRRSFSQSASDPRPEARGGSSFRR